MTEQLSLSLAMRLGDAGRRRAQVRAENAQPGFTQRAADVMLTALALDGPQSGEQLTAACERAGIVPPDARAFGAAFKMLLREGKIRRVGWCARKRGHGAAGGSVYEAT